MHRVTHKREVTHALLFSKFDTQGNRKQFIMRHMCEVVTSSVTPHANLHSTTQSRSELARAVKLNMYIVLCFEESDL